MKYFKILTAFPLLAILIFCMAFYPKTRKVQKAVVANKPNIIIIMADDLDSRQLSCYGGQNINTKNIDALAKEGLQFNHIYTSEAMCIPTRASLFTGLYPARHGAFQNHKKVNDNLKSVNHYLRDLGYRVGLTGKNHVTNPKSIFPFDIVKGFEPNCVATTDEYMLDSVRQYISQKDKPYCLFVMSINPHAPWTVGNPAEFDAAKLKLPGNWVDTKEARTEFCKYLAEVRRLDNQVGDIMKLLKETGQDKNTIVMFLGEQGPQFAGGKWTLWDYGAKSSMIVKWPGNIKSNTQTNAIVQYEDITPTLVNIAGGKPIQNLDGKSFLPVLENPSQRHRDYAYGIHNNIPEGPAYPMRSIRDTQYKLIRNLTPEKEYRIRFFMNNNAPKVTAWWASWLEAAKTSADAKLKTERIMHKPAVEFYDMQKDPAELKNLADDPKNKALIAQYTAKLEAWMKQQGDEGASMDKQYSHK